MKRFHQILLVGSYLPLCWLAMMAAHELGHVAAGWTTGGTVTKVVLHPLAISRTDVWPNPHPLVVVWAGPLLGSTLPLGIWLVLRFFRLPALYLARFLAGFCLIANGAYIGVGSFKQVGDAGEMIRHGTPAWILWAFGGVTFPAGLALWHRLGPHFGLGESRGRVDRRAAYLSLSLLVLFIAAMMLLSPRR